MKTIKTIIIGLLFLVAGSAQSQVSVNVNIETPQPVVVASPKVIIASPPDWGPAGYDYMEYYYLPDIQVYYDIRLAQYIYFGGGKWIRSSRLPAHCRNYNLYNGYKVVLNNYHGSTPYVYFNSHKMKYYKGYKGKPQKNRRDYHEHNDNGNHGNGNQGNQHHDNDNHDNHGGKGHKKEKH